MFNNDNNFSSGLLLKTIKIFESKPFSFKTSSVTGTRAAATLTTASVEAAAVETMPKTTCHHSIAISEAISVDSTTSATTRTTVAAETETPTLEMIVS